MGLAERADLIVDFTNVPVGQLRPRQRRPGRAVRRRRSPASTSSRRPGDHRPGPGVPRRARGGARPDDAAAVPASCRPSRRCRRGGRPGRWPCIEKAGRQGFERAAGEAEVEGPIEAQLGNVVDGLPGRSGCGWTRSPRTRRVGAPRSGSSTTPPPTRTRCTSTRSPSRSSTAQGLVAGRGGRGRPADPARRHRHAARAVGDRVQGHRHRLPRPGHPGARRSSTTPGQFVWHCHIVEHEDNEMMRPYRIGPVQPGQPG